MEFFQYAAYAELFVNEFYIQLIVGALCFAIVFVFQSMGLYTIASKAGYAHKWMAFVPFANTYYIGVCGQKNRCIKAIDTKIAALVCAILEFILVIGYIIFYVGLFYADRFYGPTGETQVNPFNGDIMDVYGYIGVTSDLAWAVWCATSFRTYVLSWINTLYLVARVFVLTAFFRTYAARRCFVFTLASMLFPLQGILIFAVRNNTGMGYVEFMRKEQERQYNMYRQYAGQYRPNNYNPDNPNMPYGDNAGRTPPEDPFSEFSGNDSDPFSDNENNK